MGATPDRETQIDGLFAGIRTGRLAGVVWFDEEQHPGVYHQDWRLEDDPDALAAFTGAVAMYLACEVPMLEALVIAGLVAAPLSSAVLFLPARNRARAGTWAALGRVILAVAGSVVLAAAAAGVLYLLDAMARSAQAAAQARDR